MCDKELLVGYLYDELEAADRQTFEQHLESCGECRDELQALGGTRQHLASWTPEEPDLRFQIISGAARPAPSRFRVRSAWGLAAAAALIVAVAGAIANVEVRRGSDGFVVRTGWARDAAAQTAGTGVSREELNALYQQIRDMQSALATRPGVVRAATTAADPSRLSDAELLRRMRQLIGESESRQQEELAMRLVSGMREMQAAHEADLVRFQQTINQNQGALNDEVFRQREEMKNLYRVVGSQAQR